MKYSEIDTELSILIKEMCVRVGCDYETFDFVEDWYNKYHWTEEEQLAFKEWLVTELATNKDIRRNFKLYSKNRKVLANDANWFMLQYGWTTKV